MSMRPQAWSTTTASPPARSGSTWRHAQARRAAVARARAGGIWVTVALAVLVDGRARARPVRRPAHHRRGHPRRGRSRRRGRAALRAASRWSGSSVTACARPTSSTCGSSAASENGLSTLRIKAFRHIHDLSVLTQNTERRGSLVSRVTSDVDTISMFVQFGGLMLMVNLAQIALATVLMVVYSPPLALVVWAVLRAAVRHHPPVPGHRRARLHQRCASGSATCWARSPRPSSAPQTIRAYGVEDRTAARIDASVEAHRGGHRCAGAGRRRLHVGPARRPGLTTAVVLVVGTLLAVNGRLTLGELLAFLFLVNLFTDAGAAGHRDPQRDAERRRRLAPGHRHHRHARRRRPTRRRRASSCPAARSPCSSAASAFSYPGGEQVLHDVDLTIAPRSRVAIVGETGSGKSTLAKLLTRLMDPTAGRVLLDGIDLRRRSASRRCASGSCSCRRRASSSTARCSTTSGSARPESTEDDIERTLTELGLDAWVATLPQGLGTEVGQRGESLSAGERQLVALARAYLADPDLLVLDEATSAVDPSTEVRLQRALDSLTRGRTSIAIAHRLSTAAGGRRGDRRRRAVASSSAVRTGPRAPRRRLSPGCTPPGSPSSRPSDRT